MQSRRAWVEPVIWVALAAAGIALRLSLRDLPNFAPVAAIALFAGYFFRRPTTAASLPLAIMAGSDLVIGGYSTALMVVVYTSLTLPAVLGVVLRRYLRLERGQSMTRGAAALIGSSLASSIQFFLVTNFAVWALSTSYDHSWSGLLHCYTRAVPFFRYTLQGDLFFAAVLFGGYTLALLAGWVTQLEERVGESHA